MKSKVSKKVVFVRTDEITHEKVKRAAETLNKSVDAIGNDAIKRELSRLADQYPEVREQLEAVA